MESRIRRVVTGHDDKRKAFVDIDDIPTNWVSRREGQKSIVIWTSNGYPVDNSGHVDQGKAPVGTCQEDGTVFRIVVYEPGVKPRVHRSESLDYAVVISGRVWMELDDGEEAELAAGDVLVQRGTVHNWVNRGSEPCVIAFVLIGAKPVADDLAALEATR